MKRLPLLFALFAALSGQAATLSLIDFQLGTNTISGTNAPFWAGGTPIDPSSGIMVYQLVPYVRTNFEMIQTFANALTDTQTNAIVNSPRKVFYTTNSFTIPYNGSAWLSLAITNFAGMDYTVLSGTPMPIISKDFGSNWSSAGDITGFVTNSPVMVGWSVSGFPSNSSFFSYVPGVVTNVTIYTQARSDLYGRTNVLIGQHVQLSEPQGPHEPATKAYADNLMAVWGTWSAPIDVQINGHAVNWNGAWQSLADSPGTNSDRWRLSYLGGDVVSIQQPYGQTITNVHLSVSGTNLTVTVATNGLTGPFSLRATHFVAPVSWFWLGNGPASLSGTNYTLTFGQPWTDSGFFMSVVPSTLPGVFTLSGLLQLPRMTIASRTNTTWGYGPGLFVSDGTNAWVSADTNLWTKFAGTLAW